MADGVAMIALFALAALAHDPSGCPTSGALYAAALRGPLPAALRECIADGADPDERALLVLDDLLVDPPPPDLSARVAAWLGEATRPTDTLVAAERARDPEIARALITRTEALSPVWVHPAERATSLVRLAAVRAHLDPAQSVRWAQEAAWLGVVGPPLEAARTACLAISDTLVCSRPVAPEVPPPRLPSDEDLVPCHDLGRLWTRALSSDPVYASERDCVVRALDGLDGEARTVAGHLVLLLAARHRDKEAGLVAIHRVLAVLPADPIARSTAAAWHTELGDPIGAATWALPEDPR